MHILFTQTRSFSSLTFFSSFSFWSISLSTHVQVGSDFLQLWRRKLLSLHRVPFVINSELAQAVA